MQRCHGPGAAHLKAVTSGASIDEIRHAIVNPARLDRQRQLDVCMQCHLETSSSHMPNEIRLYNRNVFSFRPGQPLGEYKLYFDPLSNQSDDRFEIAQRYLSTANVSLFQEQRDDLPHVPRSASVVPGNRKHKTLLPSLRELSPRSETHSFLASIEHMPRLPHA